MYSYPLTITVIVSDNVTFITEFSPTYSLLFYAPDLPAYNVPIENPIKLNSTSSSDNKLPLK